MAEENAGSDGGTRPHHTPDESNMSAAGSHVGAGARRAMGESGLEQEGPSIATAALIGVGVAIVEPELIPGMLIGAGAWAAPKILPALGNLLRPAVKGIVKVGYGATLAVREAVAEATEDMQDMMAEARAEYETGHAPEAQAEEPRRRRRAPRPAPASGLVQP